MSKKVKGKPLDRAEVDRHIDDCLRRLRCGKDAPYFRSLLEAMVYQGVVPLDLLKTVPLPAQEAGKTRFDQLYAAAMALVFPDYREETLRRFLGPEADVNEDKIWRICFPEKFKLAHVYMRAGTFQQAFALGCDYACRLSMRVFGTVPHDLTIRVMFVSERSLRRFLDMRWASKTHIRMQLKLMGREFTPRMLNGARLAALGHPNSPMYSIARYAEMKDLDKVRKSKGRVRRSPVESESFKKRRPT
jgi:hypothetical protein